MMTADERLERVRRIIDAWALTNQVALDAPAEVLLRSLYYTIGAIVEAVGERETEDPACREKGPSP